MNIQVLLLWFTVLFVISRRSSLNLNNGCVLHFSRFIVNLRYNWLRRYIHCSRYKLIDLLWDIGWFYYFRLITINICNNIFEFILVLKMVTLIIIWICHLHHWSCFHMGLLIQFIWMELKRFLLLNSRWLKLADNICILWDKSCLKWWSLRLLN